MFVIASKANQMCNRLFLFGSLIASAIEHNVPLVNAGFAEYSEYFETTATDLYCRYPRQRSRIKPTHARRLQFEQVIFRLASSLRSGRLRPLQGNRLRVIDSSYETTLANPDGEYDLQNPEFLHSLKRREIIFFRGPLIRDHVNFRRHADKVRDYFRPLEHFETTAAALLDRIRDTNDLVVGVHIRHGDYRSFMNGRYFYSADEYARVMTHVESLFPQKRVAFLISSNAAQPAQAFHASKWHTAPGHPVQDVYSLAKCDYLMGPPSTFSLWASFYGKIPLYTLTDVNHQPTLQDFRYE